jgi:hypothetical protein
MKVAKAEAVDKLGLLATCNEDRVLLEQEVGLFKIKSDGLQKDKEEYRQESDRFRELYVKADTERIEAINGAPSRYRWFTAGVISTLVAGILAAFARKEKRPGITPACSASSRY